MSGTGRMLSGGIEMGPFVKMVYFLGDVHGNMDRLNDFIETYVRRHPQVRQLAEKYEKDGESFDVIIMQCGDMAYYWPNMSNLGRIDNEVEFLSSGRVPIYWTGGNHEDWDRLDRLFPAGSAAERTNIAQVDDGVFFCRFGRPMAQDEENQEMRGSFFPCYGSSSLFAKKFSHIKKHCLHPVPIPLKNFFKKNASKMLPELAKIH